MTSSAPITSRPFVLDLREFYAEGPGGHRCYKTNESFGYIDTDSYNSFSQVSAICRGLKYTTTTPRTTHRLTYARSVQRIEFVYSNKNSIGGAFLFDQDGSLIVHVVNALFVANGSSLLLSSDILRILEVPQSVIDSLLDLAMANCQRKDTAPYIFVVEKLDSGWQYYAADKSAIDELERL